MLSGSEASFESTVTFCSKILRRQWLRMTQRPRAYDNEKQLIALLAGVGIKEQEQL